MRKILLLLLLLILCRIVNAQPPSIPTIPNIAICQGEWAADTANAYSAIISYRWQLSDPDQTAWADCAGNSLFNNATTDALQIYGDPSLQGHYIRCIVSNANGTTISNNAYIQIDAAVPGSLTLNIPTTTLCAGAAEYVWLDGVALVDTVYWNYTGPYAQFTRNGVYDTTAQVNFANAGAYTISASVINGCGQTVTPAIPVTVNPNATGVSGTPGGADQCTSLSIATNTVTGYADNSCSPMGSMLPDGAYFPPFASLQVCSQEDASAQSYNGIPYVPRHYTITPNFTMPAGGYVEVTLYFTQADFDAYNAVRGSNPALPTWQYDYTGISNLRVTQFHGTGTTPDTYVGGSGTIDPFDPWIVWDATNLRWSVTFDITGFSGFFVSGASLVPLPLTLTNFSGVAVAAGNQLSWQTSSEENTAYFEMQRAAAGSSAFTDLGQVAAAGNSSLTRQYSYTDVLAVTHPVYSYRLKMVDLDGHYTYSPIVTLQPTAPSLSVALSPNPFVQPVSLTVGSPVAGIATVVVLDMSGAKLVERSVVLQKGDNALDVSLIAGLPQGVYVLQVTTGTQQQTVKFVKE